MLYERLLRPLLFRLDPERAHEAMTGLLELAQGLPGGPQGVSWLLGKPAQGLEVEILGLRFPSPVGLAAGFDKDCRLVRILPALGFGFIELGSVTLRPQPGNPRPRLWRVPEASALINRMGFCGAGAPAAAKRLEALRGSFPLPLGISLGLNADCPREKAPGEYAQTFKLLEPYGDYFVVNISSPNTQGLRDLQAAHELKRILAVLQAENKGSKPVLVKLSPDLGDQDLPELLGAIQGSASGVIAANTTLSREGLPASARGLPGGLSGKPLRERAIPLIRKIYRLTQGRLPIIGVGGVFTGRDAFEMIRAGATLVQFYTALVFRGPAAALRIQEELAELLARSGYANVAEAVGTETLEVAQ